VRIETGKWCCDKKDLDRQGQVLIDYFELILKIRQQKLAKIQQKLA
jgi:hypothetical protein